MAIDVGAETATAAPTPVAAPAPPKPATSGGWGVPLAVLITGMFMSVLDISIVNVAIPTMQLDFAATTEEIQWVENAYSLALGVVVPVSAWFSGRFGPGRIYIWCLMGFAAGSALCGLAWDLESIVVFRVVQAIPGGILPVVTLTMLYQIVRWRTSARRWASTASAWSSPPRWARSWAATSSSSPTGA